MTTTGIAVDELIRRLELQPHPEGGFYRETWRAAQQVWRAGANVDPGAARSASTAIYYLLCNGAHSAWHRIRSDEVWHFYAGAPLEVYVLDAVTRALVTHRLGNALDHPGTTFQAVVRAGDWFAARCTDPSTFALVGCTVAPGFEFSEFELADVDALAAQYPAHRELIVQLRPAGASGPSTG